MLRISFSRLAISFSDPKVFRAMSTPELVRSYSLFTAFSFNPLIRHSLRLYQAVPGLFQYFARPAFAQFCAGSSEVDIRPRIARLRENGVNAILDYAAESSEDLDRNVIVLRRAISAVGEGDRVAIKLTALCPVETLTEWSSVNPVSQIPGIDRVEQVIAHAHSQKVAVYIDAEWLEIQPAIEAITMYFMQKYNKDAVTVYTTYQCYLKRTMEVAKSDIALAKQHNFKLAAKVVRGAYLTTERARAKSLNIPDPVCETYDATTNNYHAILSLLSREAAVDSVLVATHNPDSINFALSLGNAGKFAFAQLLGMADNVTLALANAQKPVFKYVPYGPMHEVMPYLLRRAVENSALMGSVHVKNERAMVKAELLRRLRP